MTKDYLVLCFNMRCKPIPSLSVWNRLWPIWSTESDRMVPYNVRHDTARMDLKRPKVLPVSLQELLDAVDLL